MRYKVPHKIDLEDRVIGPLTMKQFFYLFIGGSIDYVLYTIIANTYGDAAFYAVAALPSLIFLALAFLKVQDRTAAEFIGSLLIYIMHPKRYLWERRIDPIIVSRKKEGAKKPIIQKRVNRSDLEKLAMIVDNRGWTREEANGVPLEGQSLLGRIISSAETILKK